MSSVRIIAEHMGRALGQRMIVENRAGANGATADARRRARRSEWLHILLNASNMGTNIIGMIDPGYTWTISRVIGGISYSPFVMMANTAASKTKTLKDMMAYAKANPGKLKFASLGPQSLNALLPQRLGMLAKIDWQEVPYRSGAQVVPDLLNGTMDVYFGLLSTGVSVFGRPDIEVMGVSEPARNKLLPTVPTFAEQGFPEINDFSVNGFWVPKDTPKPVVEKLRAALEEAKKSPEFQAQVEKTGNLILQGRSRAIRCADQAPDRSGRRRLQAARHQAGMTSSYRDGAPLVRRHIRPANSIERRGASRWPPTRFSREELEMSVKGHF